MSKTKKSANLFLTFLLFLGCNQKPKEQYDPIQKTEDILAALDDEEYENLFNEQIGSNLCSSLDKDMLIRFDIRLHEQIEKHGLPDKNKIYLAETYKLPVDSLFKKEFEKDSMDVYVTEAFLGEEGNVALTFYLAETKKGLKILSSKMGEHYDPTAPDFFIK